MKENKVLVTGAAGYLGRLFVKSMCPGCQDTDEPWEVITTDIREPEKLCAHETFIAKDLRDQDWGKLLKEQGIQSVVHLAAIVTPPEKGGRQLAYEVDVEGTQHLLEGCVEAGVKRIILTSSGAAYGYHADSPSPITEAEPVRGNEAFAYAWHKRLVEEMLAGYREKHPQLEQIVFRVSTILGESTANQITALFQKSFVLDIKGATRPFVFIWDEDMAACLQQALNSPVTGIFNVTGDGSMSMGDIAARINKPHRRFPVWMLKGLLSVLKGLGATPYGPEQVRFLQYRPVLSNEKLKQEFGFVPRKTSEEAFEVYWGKNGKR